MKRVTIVELMRCMWKEIEVILKIKKKEHGYIMGCHERRKILNTVSYYPRENPRKEMHGKKMKLIAVDL